MPKDKTGKKNGSRREILQAAGVVEETLLAQKAAASGPIPAAEKPLARGYKDTSRASSANKPLGSAVASGRHRNYWATKLWG
jgi:hypothetical protein